jgi:S-adenosylmethionine hydrolase
LSSPSPVCLITDFGLRDPYVGLLKSVLQYEPPYPPVIDLTHEVPPQDEPTATFLFQHCRPRLPERAVVPVIVDPGVGTERNVYAFETTEKRVVVTPFESLVGQTDVEELHRVEDPPLYGPKTSDGLSLYGSVARFLSLDGSLSALGPAVEPPEVEDGYQRPEKENGVVTGQVVYVDRFGNLVTNIPGDQLPNQGQVEVGGTVVREIVSSIGEQEGLVAYNGSFDRVEIALAGGSAHDTLGVSRSAEVRIVDETSSE